MTTEQDKPFYSIGFGHKPPAHSLHILHGAVHNPPVHCIHIFHCAGHKPLPAYCLRIFDGADYYHPAFDNSLGV